jgi:protein-tyrosine phosphatase
MTSAFGWLRPGRVSGWLRRGEGPGAGAAGAEVAGPALSWIGDERIAVSGLPRAAAVPRLAEQGVTHVVNCRPRIDVWWSGDLAAERRVFGAERVAHAAMQDHGLRQRPATWAAAVCFAARVLDDQPEAGVLVHCSAGRHRSVMVAYAILRLRGHDRNEAAALVLRYRAEAELVPAYVRSVERWLATEAGHWGGPGRPGRPGRPGPR